MRIKKRQTRHSRMTPSSNTRFHIGTPKIAKRKRTILALKIFLLLFMAVSIFSTLSWLSFSSFLAVQSINIQGTTTLSPTAIKATILSTTAQPSLIGFFSKQNIFSFPVKSLKKEIIKKYPRIKSISITREFMKRVIVVTIEQRVPYARWCPEYSNENKVRPVNNCMTLDNTGFAFEPFLQEHFKRKEPIITFEGGTDVSREILPLRTRVAPKYFKNLSVFIEDLRVQGLEINKVNIIGTGAEVYTTEGWYLKIVLDKNLKIISFNVKTILNGNKTIGDLKTVDYIDMRFGERVYVKHK